MVDRIKDELPKNIQYNLTETNQVRVNINVIKSNVKWVYRFRNLINNSIIKSKFNKIYNTDEGKFYSKNETIFNVKYLLRALIIIKIPTFFFLNMGIPHALLSWKSRRVPLTFWKILLNLLIFMGLWCKFKSWALKC